MCGIIGIIAQEEAVPFLVEGLERLEYRGYDSAGIATMNKGKISRIRVAGKISKLVSALNENQLSGTVGMGHTRWATHGAAIDKNAHPHLASMGGKKVAVVHNGIIENWKELKENMNLNLTSETDSEVIAHLFVSALAQHKTHKDALLAGVKQLKGSFALAILIEDENDTEAIYGISRGSPLALGRGGGQVGLASDGLAISHWAKEIIYMKDGDFVIIKPNRIDWFNFNGDNTNETHSFEPINIENNQISKKGYQHFTRKEIDEQPKAIESALAHYLDGENLNFPTLPNQNNIENVLMIGCGGAINAAHTARYWIEKYAKLPAHEEVASEFRDRNSVVPKNSLIIFVSQSGETADTMMAFNHCQEQGYKSVAIVNQSHSTLARSADLVLMMLAGTEIGVAATKSFTSQLVLLALTTLQLSKIEGSEKKKHIKALKKLPALMREVLAMEEQFKKVAQDALLDANYILHLGRGNMFPIALEGALKMKEISYVPSEGYAAGEMKHGPIAMIDDKTPIITLSPHNELFKKTLSNMEEVHARGGKVILISDEKGARAAGDVPAYKIILPDIDDFTAPILYVLAVQFLSYHTANLKGLDIDQPRNLAKSVTVE